MAKKNYSSIDNSPSKQCYSFSRAPRFPKISSYGAMNFYNIPQVTSKRAPSFGYGFRYDFTPKKENITPSPYSCENYTNQSNHPYSPRFSFGLGREIVKSEFDQKFPGPGNYNVVHTMGNEGAKYSMKGRHGNNLFNINSSSPGPALYENVLKINPEGIFVNSKFKNVQSVDFSRAGARFPEIHEKTPGPADYKKSSLLGNIFNSRFKSSHGRPLEGRYQPFSYEINNNPGPGAYEAYSDFDKQSRFNTIDVSKSRLDSGKSRNKGMVKIKTEKTEGNDSSSGADKAEV